MNYTVGEHGFEIVAGVLDGVTREKLESALGAVHGAGRRGILQSPTVAALARSPELLGLIRAYCPSEPFPVRAIYFDKCSESNWMYCGIRI